MPKGDASFVGYVLEPDLILCEADGVWEGRLAREK